MTFKKLLKEELDPKTVNDMLDGLLKIVQTVPADKLAATLQQAVAANKQKIAAAAAAKPAAQQPATPVQQPAAPAAVSAAKPAAPTQVGAPIAK